MASHPGSAIVTDSSLRTALYTIRSLGRRGVRITVVDRATRASANLGGLSRYVSRRVVVPDNRREPERFTDAVLALSGQHDVLLPMGMHSIEPIARRADEFRARIRFALPDWATIERADNTRLLLQLAQQLDVPQPAAFAIDDFPTLEALAAEVPYPAIVKTGLESGLPPSERYRVVRAPTELMAAVRRFQAYVDQPLVQELVQGDGIGFEALYNFDGLPVATFCHRRLRQYPLSGGPSTYCESCHIPLAVIHGKRLLDFLHWTGLAMVEFKVDDRTGIPKLMEINPRPWGSMALPIAAGVDFPWLAFQLARDGSLPVQPDHRDGVRLRFWVNDLQAAAAEARGLPGLSAKLRILGSLLDPRVHEGILSWRDPLPSLAYLLKAVRRTVDHGAEPMQ